MPYRTDTEIDLTPQTTSKYIISSQHRRIGNPYKCVWTITYQEEVNCFIQAKTSNWINGKICWGLKVVGNALQAVGRNTDNEDLKFAKFIDGTNTDVWHGYPADYLNRSQDRPTTAILLSWQQSNYLGKHHVRKIKQGIPCNL